jgi:hypothetical protein
VTPADEAEDFPSAHHGDPGETLTTVDRAESDRRVGTHGVGHTLEDLASGGPKVRPTPLHQTDERIADRRGQCSLGQASSMIVARIAPVAAAARPLLRASLLRTREKKDGGRISSLRLLFLSDMFFSWIVVALGRAMTGEDNRVAIASRTARGN